MPDSKQREKYVLFLTRQYAPIPKVCEICVGRVREALFEKGIKSDVLQFTGEEGLVETLPIGNVYSVGAGKGKLNITYKNEFVHFCMKASVAYRWPFFYSYQMNAKYRNRIRELDEKNHYDAIIGMALPVDTAIAGIGFKNYIFYELDAITNNPLNSGIIKSILKYRIKNLEKKVFDEAALIIHMECNRNYFNKKKYLGYKDKSVYADIPNLIKFPKMDLPKRTDKILCGYFGSLGKEGRNPTYLIKLIEAIQDEIDIECEFYSRGNCEDILGEAEARNPEVIHSMGYVMPDKVIESQNRVDFLLSIGNKLSGEDRSLPSKIIEYMAVGKPIIHIHGGKNDSAIPYLEQYELICIINPEDNFDENVLKTLSFIRESIGRTISFDDIKALFYHNTPAYTAQIILNYLERK